MPKQIIPRGTSLEDRIFFYISPEPTSGCWIWVGAVDRGGYGKINVEGRFLSAHRASYEAFFGPIPRGLSILHKCDVPTCCNPRHLFVGNQDENMKDAARKGRKGYKLTHQQVVQIRGDNRAPGIVAKEYGVTATHISSIRKRLYWNLSHD